MGSFFSNLVKSVILGAIRHVFTTTGGAIVAHGWMTSAQDQQWIGAGMTFIGLSWSAYSKYKAQADKAAAVALVSGKPAT